MSKESMTDCIPRCDITSFLCLDNCFNVLGCPQLFVNNLLKIKTRRKAISIVADEIALATAMTSPIVILASSSVNRLKLLRSINIEPKVVCSNYEEDLPKTLPVKDFVEQTAHEKLKAVSSDMRQKQEPFDVIIACDTVIYFENEIIGKPVDKEEAIVTLKRLRNNTHLCYTGVAIAYPDGTEDIFNVESTIEFGDYPDNLIEAYVATGEPLSRAGSYGIQGFAAVFVKSVHGSFPNIVGLPIHEVHTRLILKGVLKY